MSSNYTPIVARLEGVTPIAGADRVVSATASGYTLVVGSEHNEGELGVVFPAEGVLDLGFAQHAGVLREHPVTGAKLDGYLDNPPRIRCLTIRGVKTGALWLPLDVAIRAMWSAFPSHFGLTTAGKPIADLAEGDAIEELTGVDMQGVAVKPVHVARKYMPPPEQRAREKQPRDASPENRKRREYRKAVREAMPEHYKTPPAQRAVNSITYGAVVRATEKLHGTSGMVARRRLPIGAMKRAINRLGSLVGRQPFAVTEVVAGTRRTVLMPDGHDPFIRLRKENIDLAKRNERHDIRDAIGPRLLPGEVVYFEIVGYYKSGSPIQKHTCAEKSAETKAIRAQFGADIPYAYGCVPDGVEMGPANAVAPAEWPADAVAKWRAPRYRVFVYRITQDGKELPFELMRKRALELSLEVPPVLGQWRHLEPGATHVRNDGLTDEELFARHRAANKETLRRAQELAEGKSGLLPSTIDPRTPREGVVLRADSGEYVGASHVVCKYKAHGFGVLEGYAKDRGEVDVEEEDDALDAIDRALFGKA